MLNDISVILHVRFGTNQAKVSVILSDVAESGCHNQECTK